MTASPASRSQIAALQTQPTLAKSLPHADMEAIASSPRLQGQGGGRGLSGQPPANGTRRRRDKTWQKLPRANSSIR